MGEVKKTGRYSLILWKDSPQIHLTGGLCEGRACTIRRAWGDIDVKRGRERSSIGWMVVNFEVEGELEDEEWDRAVDEYTQRRWRRLQGKI